MTTAAPGWYADPSHQHALRYWDGSAWTDHVAEAPPPPPEHMASTRRLGRAALILCVIAAVAIAVPAVSLARADDASIRLDGSTQRLGLTPDTRYGIYVDDADNSGYPSRCSAHDAEGHLIPLRSPGFAITSSDTEMLDFVFDSGSGQVTLRCSAGDEKVTTHQLEPAGALAIGILVAGVFGSLGVALLVSWLVKTVSRRRRTRTGSVQVGS